MGSEVDVFISNYTLVDPEIYQLWVDGHSASEAVSILNQRGLGQITGASLELIASDVLDHFRTYFLIEKLLIKPNKLQEQLAFQIEPASRQVLIEKYYDFDDDVARELIGKKLTSKHRKDLDEIAEKTGVPVKSCRRQFDNVKRIFKVVEDMSGVLVVNIQNSFYLPENIAQKYACLIFWASIRFETSKRKLNHVTFPCWKRCTKAIIEHWTSNHIGGVDYFDNELDKGFFAELKEVKVLENKERELKRLVCEQLKPNLSHKKYSDLDANFVKYTRSLLNVPANVGRGKDMKNMFVELTSVTEVLKAGLWSYQETEQFLKAYWDKSMEIEVVRESPVLKNTVDKFMKVIVECTLAIYLL